MEKKISAVEWLVLHLNKEEWFTHKQKQTIEQAKQMEKEQIINAYTIGVEEDIYYNPLKTGEEYYNETFKLE